MQDMILFELRGQAVGDLRLGGVDPVAGAKGLGRYRG